jgi:hypothetical protein
MMIVSEVNRREMASCEGLALRLAEEGLGLPGVVYAVEGAHPFFWAVGQCRLTQLSARPQRQPLTDLFNSLLNKPSRLPKPMCTRILALLEEVRSNIAARQQPPYPQAALIPVMECFVRRHQHSDTVLDMVTNSIRPSLALQEEICRLFDVRLLVLEAGERTVVHRKGASLLVLMREDSGRWLVWQSPRIKKYDSAVIISPAE